MRQRQSKRPEEEHLLQSRGFSGVTETSESETAGKGEFLSFRLCGHTVSVAATQLCCYSMKPPIDNTYMGGPSCVSLKSIYRHGNLNFI